MESLGINLKFLIAQIINFALFLFIFHKFISKPFSAFLNDEIKKEQEKQRMFDEIKKKEENIASIEVKAREKVKKEYDAAAKQVKEEVVKLKASLVEDAKKSAEEIVSKGRAQIEDEHEKMYKEIRKKVADLSILLVEKGLDQFLTKDRQKEITQYILKNLPKHLSN